MLIGTACGASAARRAVEKAELQQIRLVNILKRHGFFADRGGKRFQSHRAAVEKFDNGCQHPAVSHVKP